MSKELPNFLEWMTKHYLEYHKYDLANSGVANTYMADLDLPPVEIELSMKENLFRHPKITELIAKHENVDPEMVFPIASSSCANLLTFAHFVSHGDDVLIENPVYEPLVLAAKHRGANVIKYERTYENKFQIDAEQLESLVTPKTKLMVMTNLHNPSGVLTPPETIKAIGEIAEKHDFWVLCDQVFLDVLDDKRPPVAAATHPRFITTKSLTKVYGLGAMRFGWMITAPELIDELMALNFLYVYAIQSPSVNIGIAILENLDQLKERTRNIVGPNFEAAKKWIAENEHLEWVEPDGGIISYPRWKVDVDSMEVANLLMEKYDTFMVPGTFFGHPQNIRLCMGNKDNEIFVQGLKNISSALEDCINK